VILQIDAGYSIEKKLFVFFVSFVRTGLDILVSQGFKEDLSQSSQPEETLAHCRGYPRPFFIPGLAIEICAKV
jgi:hypothetical protein